MHKFNNTEFEKSTLIKIRNFVVIKYSEEEYEFLILRIKLHIYLIVTDLK